MAGRNPLRFAAGELDTRTNLVKFGVRHYDPNTGRFTQQDSIERPGDLTQGNRYAYAACNPTNFTGSSSLSGVGADRW